MKKNFLFLNIIFSVQLLSQNISFDIGSPVTEIELTSINKEKIKLSIYEEISTYRLLGIMV